MEQPPEISVKLVLGRLFGLLRGRYIMATIGIAAMMSQPAIAEYILGAVAIACGVSAVDAWRGGKKED